MQWFGRSSGKAQASDIDDNYKLAGDNDRDLKPWYKHEVTVGAFILLLIGTVSVQSGLIIARNNEPTLKGVPISQDTSIMARAMIRDYETGKQRSDTAEEIADILAQATSDSLQAELDAQAAIIASLEAQLVAKDAELDLTDTMISSLLDQISAQESELASLEDNVATTDLMLETCANQDSCYYSLKGKFDILFVLVFQFSIYFHKLVLLNYQKKGISRIMSYCFVYLDFRSI